MGLLDSIIGSVVGGNASQQQGAGTNPLVGILMSLLAARAGGGGLGGMLGNTGGVSLAKVGSVVCSAAGELAGLVLSSSSSLRPATAGRSTHGSAKGRTTRSHRTILAQPSAPRRLGGFRSRPAWAVPTCCHNSRTYFRV